jgi:hypothetical protein
MAKKTKKKSSSPDMDSIKEFERQKRQKLLDSKKSEPAKEKELDFNSWWAKRSAVLNSPNHLKEILKADAKARGVDGLQTMDKWDWAAKMFGLEW